MPKNRYLEKIAASREDELDAAKTYGRATLAGWGGYLGGAAAGGLAGVGLAAALRGRSAGRLGKLVSNVRASRPISSAEKAFNKVKNSGFVNKYKGVLATGAVGAAIGSHVGEEGSHYAATRAGVLQAKENARNEKRAEEKMGNKYLEKIAKTMTEKQLNSHAWGTMGYGAMGGVLGAPVPVVGSVAGDMAGRGYRINRVVPEKDLKKRISRAAGSWAHGTVGGLGGGLAGVGVGGLVGAGIGALGAAALRKSPEAGIIAGAGAGAGLVGIAGALKGNQLMTRKHLRNVLKDKGYKFTQDE